MPREPLFPARELFFTDTEPFLWSHCAKRAMAHWHWAISVIFLCQKLCLTDTDPFQWSHCAKRPIIPGKRTMSHWSLSHFSDLTFPREPLFLAKEYVSLTLSQKRAIFPGKITMSHWHWAISVISLCQKELWLTDTEPFQLSHCAILVISFSQESHFSWQDNYVSRTLSHFSDLTVPKELWLTDTEPFQWSYCVKNYVSLTLSHFSDLTFPIEPFFLAR